MITLLAREVEPGDWSPRALAERGGATWRRNAERGDRIPAPDPSWYGSRVYFRPEMVGRPLADLRSPFDALLDLEDRGATFLAHTHDAVVVRWNERPAW